MNRDVHPAKTHAVIGSAIEVHRELGPGLLESTYRACLIKQLFADGMWADEEVAIPISYKGHKVDSGYRADLIVDKLVLVELKAVETMLPIHEAQLMTYLKHTNLPVGLLINFNVRNLVQGVRRFVRAPTVAAHLA